MWKKVFNILLSTLLTFLVIGCSSDVKEKDLSMSEEDRTFDVGQVWVDTVGTSGMNNIEVLKNGKILNYSACIKDRALGRNMSHRYFTVTGAEIPQRKQTDENGCLHWSEAISIESYKSMGFQSLVRTINGEGPYYGALTIEFGFQPLEDGSNAVVDLRHADLPSSDSSKALRGNRPRFMLDKIEIVPAISAQTQEMLKTPYREVAVTIKAKLLEEQTGRGITKHKFKIVLSDTPNVEDWDAVPTLEYAMNTSGDFMTSATIRYKRFAGECYFKKYLVVKSMELPFDETPVSREVYINPWQWWEKFFFLDSRDGKIDKEYLNCSIRPQLLIQETWLSYTANVEDSYRLDKHLNFTFSKNYQLKFRPILNRRKIVVPRDELLYEKGTIAELKARMTLIRPKNGAIDLTELEERGIAGLDDYEYVTGTEVVVPVRRALATVNFDLTFDFTDIPFMVTRSLLLIEISPYDQDWEVDPALVVITMKAGEFWVTEGALFSTKINENGHVPEGWLDRVNAGKKITPDEINEMPSEFLPRDKWRGDLIDPLSSYIEHQTRSNPNMKVLDEVDADDFPLFEKLRTNRTLFKNLYNYASGTFSPESYRTMEQYYAENNYLESMYRNFMREACDLFYPSLVLNADNYGAYGYYNAYDPSITINSDCKYTKEPTEFLTITPITFLTGDPLFKSIGEKGEEVNYVMKISTGRDKFGVNLNLKKGYGSGKSDGVSNSFGISLSSLLNLVPPLGAAAQKVGLNAGYSYADSRVTSDTETTDAGVASSYSLISDHLQLAFTAPTRSCLLVEKRRDLIKQGDSERAKTTYMICSSQENSMQYFSEDWYFVNPANTDLSHFVDYNGIQNRNMIYPIRGIHNFVGFRDLISSNLDTFLHTNQELEQPLVRLALIDLFNISPKGIPAFTDSHYPGLIIGNTLD